MIRLQRGLLVLLVVLTFLGCGGASTQPFLTNPPVAGTPESFEFTIQNNSQWDINLGVSTNPVTGQTGNLIIPSGGHVTLDLGLLPAWIYVTGVQTTATPPYTFPDRFLQLGTDYGPYDTAVSIGFPYP